MLDERTSRILEKINALCGEGGFRIVEEKELFSALPAEQLENGEQKRLLRDLEGAGYLEIKYAEDGVYCLCPTLRGKRYFESVREKRYEGERRRREVFLTTALGAFAGALLASLLVFFLSLWVGA